LDWIGYGGVVGWLLNIMYFYFSPPRIVKLQAVSSGRAPGANPTTERKCSNPLQNSGKAEEKRERESGGECTGQPLQTTPEFTTL
jgi:hypothetical protein